MDKFGPPGARIYPYPPPADVPKIDPPGGGCAQIPAAERGPPAHASPPVRGARREPPRALIEYAVSGAPVSGVNEQEEDGEEGGEGKEDEEEKGEEQEEEE